MKFYIANAILIFLNSYIVLRFAKHMHLLKYNFSIFSIIIFLVAFQNMGFDHESKWLSAVEHSFNSEKIATFIYQASYLLFGTITCLFFYNIVIDIFKIFLKSTCSASSQLPIYIDKFYVIGLTLATAITVILGVTAVLKGPIVEKVEIFIKDLPNEFNNFKIVQISDLHVGKIIKREYVLNVVNIANSLSPNLVALTGDFVDGSVQQLENDVKPLSNIKSSHGTFFVTGNHEYYSGAEQWVREFTKLGAKVLSNEHVVINNGNAQLIIAGVTDFSTIRLQLPNASSPSKALVGAPDNLVKILLAHQPTSYIEAHKAGYDLQLSGHTHGGQYFPFTQLIRFFHKYYRGLNNHEGMWIYINRGTGYWGPPLRLGASPEITLIVLKTISN
jgi:predicted MPP superfamily phosphohydrolase